MTRVPGLPTLRGMLRTRIEETCRRRGLLYSWWVPATSYSLQLICVLLAVGVRDQLWPMTWLLPTAVALVVVLPLLELYGARALPWWLDPLGPALAAVLLLAVPTGGAVIDTAPALLAILTAQAMARDGVGPAVVVAGGSVLLILTTPFGPAVQLPYVHVIDVMLGLMVGAMLRAQMRALAAEREARERAWQQATTAERERIAREIHDLVAHSLSVTLLHITGARHALLDVDDDEAGTAAEAAAEVDSALADAERVGRQAMSDIRRTVSALAEGPEPTRALPDARQIGALVDQVRRAGLAVDYDERGDLAALPPATGLGLYRVVQESLSNVAKHAPDSTAAVALHAGPRQVRLTIRNRRPGSTGLPAVGGRPLAGVPGTHGASDGHGSGLAGMKARAAQLGGDLLAGPDGEDWVVDLRVKREACALRTAATGIGAAGDVPPPAAEPQPGTGPIAGPVTGVGR